MKEDLGGCLDGMLSEYVVLFEEDLVLLPAHLTYEEGATLLCAAVTAWNALVTRGGLTSGETVLVLGTGGCFSLCHTTGQIVWRSSYRDLQL